MNSTIIKIALELRGSKPPEPRKEYSSVNILEKIHEYVQDVDSGMDDNRHQWEYLKALFLKLHVKKTLNDTEKDLLELIEPTIMKYCEYDPHLAAKIDGAQLNKYKDENHG